MSKSINPADHGGVPMCSHLACPSYVAPRKMGDEPRCLTTGNRPSDVCIPAVRLLSANAEKILRNYHAECPDECDTNLVDDDDKVVESCSCIVPVVPK